MESKEPTALPEDEEIQQIENEEFLDRLREEELEGYLKDRKRRDDYRRSSKLLDSVHNNITLIISLAVVFGFFVALVYFLHITAPSSWHWLDSSSLTKLENIFTSAFSFISGVGVTIFLTRYFAQE